MSQKILTEFVSDETSFLKFKLLFCPPPPKKTNLLSMTQFDVNVSEKVFIRIFLNFQHHLFFMAIQRWNINNNNHNYKKKIKCLIEFVANIPYLFFFF